MILQSRKWRLLFRVVALIITSVLMLAFAGPVSYALQDDTPRDVTSPVQILDKHNPMSERYANVRAVPDLANAFAIKEGTETHYWVPLRGYSNLLFVRTDNIQYLLPLDYTSPNKFWDRSQVHYMGKVTTLKGQAESQKVIQELGKRGFRADEEQAMVLIQGEKPSAYRPMVPVMPALALMWTLAFAGLLQIWRGRRPVQGASRLAPASRTTR